MKFLIRADASNEIGSGHVMRCVALGQQLIDRKHDVYFLTKTNNELILNKLEKEKFRVIKVKEKTNLTNDVIYTVKNAIQNKIDWIILDGYQFTTDYQKKIKSNSFKFLCIDDLAEKHFVSDIVLNQNLNADKIFNYSCEPYTKLLLGTKYILLRREFLKERNWRKEFNKNCKNVLITMGGSDPQNNTEKILSAINNIEKKLNIKIVLGADYNSFERIKTLSRSSKHQIEQFMNIKNMVPIMKWADLAITSAGSTVWELAYLQTPIITGIIADNQKFVAQQLEDEKFAENLGWIRNTEEIDIKNKINILINENEKRKFIFDRISKIKNTIDPEVLLNFLFRV